MKHAADSLAEGVEIKVVGKSGQISLGKRFAGKKSGQKSFKNGMRRGRG